MYGIKRRITYQHPMKEGVELEVVGYVIQNNETTTVVQRVDGYNIDFPTANILTNEECAKQ